MERQYKMIRGGTRWYKRLQDRRRRYKRSFERPESVPDGTRQYKMVRQRVSDERLTRAYKRIRDTTIQYEMVRDGYDGASRVYNMVRVGTGGLQQGFERTEEVKLES